jgi:hypothetical protein
MHEVRQRSHSRSRATKLAFAGTRDTTAMLYCIDGLATKLACHPLYSRLVHTCTTNTRYALSRCYPITVGKPVPSFLPIRVVGADDWMVMRLLSRGDGAGPGICVPMALGIEHCCCRRAATSACGRRNRTGKGEKSPSLLFVEREVRFGRYLVVFPTDKLTACRAKDFRRPRVCLEPTSKLHFWMFALPALLEASD